MVPGAFEVPLRPEGGARLRRDGGPLTVGVRSEDVRVGAGGDASAQVHHVENHGVELVVTLRAGETLFKATVPATTQARDRRDGAVRAQPGAAARLRRGDRREPGDLTERGMKIGFCMLLWTTSVTAEHRRLLEDIRATGYDGVEIPIFGGTPDDYARIGRMLDEIGLGRTGISVMPPEADALSADPALRKAAVRAAGLGRRLRRGAGGDLRRRAAAPGARPVLRRRPDRGRVRADAGGAPGGRRRRRRARASASRWRRSTGSRATSPTPWTTSLPTSPRSAIRRSR